MYNYYPEQLKTIVTYIEALNDAEKKIIESKVVEPLYIKDVRLTDNDGTDYGKLVDEIGGAWSWVPPSPVTPVD